MGAEVKAQQSVEAEHWVIRVMQKDGRDVRLSDMNLLTRLSTLALVNSDALVLLPDGRIGKPVEGYTSEEFAHERRMQLRADHPGVDFRVIMTFDL